jgi:hypothetical protein
VGVEHVTEVFSDWTGTGAVPGALDEEEEEEEEAAGSSSESTSITTTCCFFLGR